MPAPAPVPPPAAATVIAWKVVLFSALTTIEPATNSSPLFLSPFTFKLAFERESTIFITKAKEPAPVPPPAITVSTEIKCAEFIADIFNSSVITALEAVTLALVLKPEAFALPLKESNIPCDVLLESVLSSSCSI